LRFIEADFDVNSAISRRDFVAPLVRALKVFVDVAASGEDDAEDADEADEDDILEVRDLCGLSSVRALVRASRLAARVLVGMTLLMRFCRL